MTGGRVIFVGAVHEAVPALGVLIDSEAEIAEVVTMPAERAGSTSGFVDLEPLAQAHGIAVRRCADINSAESVQRVRELRPDLMVVTGWTRLLSADLLGVPAHGVVGFHASLLPHYRGRAPVNWAILRGEAAAGNTMMYLDPGTDTGDIIDQQPVPITPEDTCATVYAKVGEAGAGMLGHHLPALLAGTAPRRPQGPADGPPLPKRTPGMGITDWNRPARAVHDWIRALTWPYPGAFTFLAGRKVMLWASALARPGGGADAGPGGAAGEVLGWDADSVRVGTAAGVILLTSMSDADGAAGPAAAWAERNGLRPGDRFEPVSSETAAWALGLGPKPAEDHAR
jgi:methionyl-tRNA formyltransferase